MKSMTCNQLGGACDEIFTANSFEEIAQQSRAHGAEMAAQNDQTHIDAMNQMRELMQSPDQMLAWQQEKKQLFETLPESS